MLSQMTLQLTFSFYDFVGLSSIYLLTNLFIIKDLIQFISFHSKHTRLNFSIGTPSSLFFHPLIIRSTLS